MADSPVVHEEKVMKFTINNVSFAEKKSVKSEKTQISVEISDKEIEKIIRASVPEYSKDIKDDILSDICAHIFDSVSKKLGEKISGGQIWANIKTL